MSKENIKALKKSLRKRIESHVDYLQRTYGDLLHTNEVCAICGILHDTMTFITDIATEIGKLGADEQRAVLVNLIVSCIKLKGIKKVLVIPIKMGLSFLFKTLRLTEIEIPEKQAKAIMSIYGMLFMIISMVKAKVCDGRK